MVNFGWSNSRQMKQCFKPKMENSVRELGTEKVFLSRKINDFFLKKQVIVECTISL